MGGQYVSEKNSRILVAVVAYFAGYRRYKCGRKFLPTATSHVTVRPTGGNHSLIVKLYGLHSANKLTGRIASQYP